MFLPKDKFIEILKDPECPLGKINKHNIFDVTEELVDFILNTEEWKKRDATVKKLFDEDWQRNFCGASIW